MKGHILCESIYMRLVRFMETESRTVLPRAGWGRGDNGELVLKWDRVSVWEEQRVLEMDGSDCYTQRELVPLKCIVENS